MNAVETIELVGSLVENYSALEKPIESLKNLSICDSTTLTNINLTAQRMEKLSLRNTKLATLTLGKNQFVKSVDLTKSTSITKWTIPSHANVQFAQNQALPEHFYLKHSRMQTITQQQIKPSFCDFSECIRVDPKMERYEYTRFWECLYASRMNLKGQVVGGREQEVDMDDYYRGHYEEQDPGEYMCYREVAALKRKTPEM